MDLLLIVFVFLLAFYFGWNANNWWTNYTISKLKQDIDDDLDTIHTFMTKNIVNVKLVEMHDIIYAYDMKDDSFLCQGKTKQEIMECFAKRYPDKKGLIHE
jgi:hypothetical protein